MISSAHCTVSAWPVQLPLPRMRSNLNHQPHNRYPEFWPYISSHMHPKFSLISENDQDPAECRPTKHDKPTSSQRPHMAKLRHPFPPRRGAESFLSFPSGTTIRVNELTDHMQASVVAHIDGRSIPARRVSQHFPALLVSSSLVFCFCF